MKKKFNVIKFIIIFFLIVYTVILFSQWGWAILSSFKNGDDFDYNILGLPKKWFFDNYTYALSQFKIPVYPEGLSGGEKIVGMGEMYLYAVLYAVGCAFTSTFVPCVVAYVVARFDFKPLKLVYLIVIVCMVIPLVGTLPAQLRVATALHINNHIWGLWIMTGHFLGVYFLVFYATFKTLSTGYTEAAKIDGANNLTIMFSIIFPLARNLFFTIFLLQFVTFWNDYQTIMVFAPAYPTVSVGLYYVNSSTEDRMLETPLQFTTCILVLIPILVVFLIFREKLMGNLSMGGMKE